MCRTAALNSLFGLSGSTATEGVLRLVGTDGLALRSEPLTATAPAAPAASPPRPPAKALTDCWTMRFPKESS